MPEQQTTTEPESQGRLENAMYDVRDSRRWRLFERGDDGWQPRAPYGSVDAGYFLRGGRYFGCGISLLLLAFPVVILGYGLYAISQAAINYELVWLPLSTLQCATALAIFVFAPLLPFRLWMLFTAINKDNQDTQQEKPMPTKGRMYQNEWDGWGKEETRAYLKSRPAGKGAGYLVMVGLFDEASAMPRLVKSISRLKYTLSDNDEKAVYKGKEGVEELRQKGKHKDASRLEDELPLLRQAQETSPLDLMLLVEEKEEEIIQEKVDKALGRTKEEHKLKMPEFVQGCFWFFSALLRLVMYIFIPIAVFKWFSTLASRRNFGDPEEYSRNRDNGDTPPVPKPKPVPITTHQSAVREILKLPPEKRGRFVIARVPKPGFDRYLGKSEPQTKPRALNFGLFHNFAAAEREAVRFERVPWDENFLGFIENLTPRIAGPTTTDNPTPIDLDRVLGFQAPRTLHGLSQLRTLVDFTLKDSQPGQSYSLTFGSLTRRLTQAQLIAALQEIDKQLRQDEIQLAKRIAGYFNVDDETVDDEQEAAKQKAYRQIVDIIQAAFGTPVIDDSIQAYIEFIDAPDPKKEAKKAALTKVTRRLYESDFAKDIWDLLLSNLREDKPVPVWKDYHLKPHQTAYTVVYDAEDRPEEDQLLKAVREYQADHAMLEKLRVKSVIAALELLVAPRNPTASETPYKFKHGSSFTQGCERLKHRLMDADSTGRQPSLPHLRAIEQEQQQLLNLIQSELTKSRKVMTFPVMELRLSSLQGWKLRLPNEIYDDDVDTIGDFFAQHLQQYQTLQRDPDNRLQSGSFLRAFLHEFDQLINFPAISRDERTEILRALVACVLEAFPKEIRDPLRKHFELVETHYQHLFDIIKEIDEQAVCFQAKLTYENLNDNWVISLFKADYASWFNYLLPGLHHNRMAIPLGGTSNHFKVGFLQHVGGWDAYNVAEDCDLGMWIARHGKQVRVLNSITWEVANHDITKWVGQRSRWIKGYAQSYFVHMRRPLLLLNDLGWRRFWGFQFTVGAGFLMPMLSPFFYVMTGIYLLSLVLLIVVGFASADGTLEAAKIPLRYIYDIHYYWILPFGTGSFFIANIIYFLILVIGQLRHPKPGNMRLIVSWWWLYWIFMNAAAIRALWEYIFKPFHWDKSDHSYL